MLVSKQMLRQPFPYYSGGFDAGSQPTSFINNKAEGLIKIHTFN
jgi:hypothetical protein